MLNNANHRVAAYCIGGVAAMAALTAAAVPLYKLYCQVTGTGGTTQRAERPPGVVLEKIVTVRFDSNVSKDLPWRFEPVARTVDVKLGESTLAFYRATNMSDKPVTGTAMFNVSPDVAGIYFNKIECFCFKEQTLAAGESIEMPVSFFVDPKIVEDRDAAHVKEITLSYTFYPVTGAAVGAAPPPEGTGKGG